MSDSSRPCGLQPTRLLRPWDFPGRSTGVGCHCLLQKKKGRKVKNVGIWCVCIHFRVLGRHCLGWLRIVQASLSHITDFRRLWVQKVVSQCSRNFSGTQNFMGLETGSSTEWLMLFLETAAAAKSLQSCPTLCDPIDGSHQAPPSLGFSRQEHWSGLLFPSPMHENEK